MNEFIFQRGDGDTQGEGTQTELSKRLLNTYILHSCNLNQVTGAFGHSRWPSSRRGIGGDGA